MADHEAEVLEREEPPRHPGVGVFSPGHPLKGRVVREEGEIPPQQVIPQLQDCPLYGQSLFLDGSVVPLSLRQLPADEQDRVFLTFLYLGQDGVGSVRLQQKGAAEIRGSQDRFLGQCALDLVECLLCLWTPNHALRLPLSGQVCQGGG